MSSSDRVWDSNAQRWIRFSSSKNCWIDVETGKPVSVPRPAPRNGGGSAQQSAKPGRTSGTSLQAATDQLRSLNIKSNTNPAAATQPSGSSSTPAGQRTSAQTPAQTSGIRNTAPYNQTVRDTKTGLQTRWEVSETTPYRDPGNASSNRGLNVKRIRQLDGRREGSSDAPARDFKVYRVIEVALVPPEDMETSNVSRITPTNTSSMNVRNRRFVIVREVPDKNTFEALAIKTYNGRGVSAPGVIKSHHSIIYTSPCPRPTEGELPGRTTGGQLENGMQPSAIRIVQFDRGTALDPMSRLDYADRYEFDWGVPNITLFGRVHDESHAALFLQYNAVWSSIRLAVQGHMSTSTSATTSTPNIAAPTTDLSQGAPSNIATAGSSRAGDSSTSGTTESAFLAARALIARYAASNSGQCTDAEMANMLAYLREVARRSNRTQPQASQALLSAMARDASKRANYIQQVYSQWKKEKEESDEEEESD